MLQLVVECRRGRVHAFGRCWSAVALLSSSIAFAIRRKTAGRAGESSRCSGVHLPGGAAGEPVRLKQHRLPHGRHAGMDWRWPMESESTRRSCTRLHDSLALFRSIRRSRFMLPALALVVQQYSNATWLSSHCTSSSSCSHIPSLVSSALCSRQDHRSRELHAAGWLSAARQPATRPVLVLVAAITGSRLVHQQAA